MTATSQSRMTKQRRLILEELRKVTDHPTADKIYRTVRKQMPRISLGTIYRNLESLAQQGEIQKLTIDGDRVRYDGNAKEHLHIRCTVCGRVDDLPIEANVSLTELSPDFEYKIDGYKLEFTGKCPDCMKAERS